MPDATDFDAVYQRHVDAVVAGDLRTVMADMNPTVVPEVFEGVIVPKGDVTEARVIATVTNGAIGIGQAVYETPAGPIGLVSTWLLIDGSWKADELANFAPVAR